MAEWIQKALGELTAYMSKGIAPKYVGTEGHNTVRVLNQKCNRNFEISYADSRIHDLSAKKVPVEKMVSAGDVLINSTGTGTAGRVAQIWNVPSPTIVDGHMIILRPTSEICQQFYGYALKLAQGKIEELAEGSTGQTEINRERLKNEIIISYPVDIEDQLKVSAFLSNVDEKIKNNAAINNNLLQQASTIFKHWFTDNPNLDNMEQVPLAELCSVVTKGTTPTTLGKPFVSEGINFIKAESILDNHAIDKDKFAFIDSETNDLLRRSIINAGDIVFTIAGTLGRFALIDDSILPANTNQAVAIIRANQSKATPEYLYSFFLGNWHNDYYTKRIQQAVQANLSLGTIKSLPIPTLSEKAMADYLGIICPIIQMTKANELEITRLRTMRDALLPQLMSGELDVSSLDL